MQAPLVFFDIAGPDSAVLRRFYGDLFGWQSTPGGNMTVNLHSPLQGTIRQEPKEVMLYFGVPDITAKLAEIVDHGGSQETARFEVPGVVILALFRDPAGNRMGLVEVDGNGVAIVP